MDMETGLALTLRWTCSEALGRRVQLGGAQAAGQQVRAGPGGDGGRAVGVVRSDRILNRLSQANLICCPSNVGQGGQELGRREGSRPERCSWGCLTWDGEDRGQEFRLDDGAEVSVGCQVDLPMRWSGRVQNPGEVRAAGWEGQPCDVEAPTHVTLALAPCRKPGPAPSPRVARSCSGTSLPTYPITPQGLSHFLVYSQQ